MLSSWEGPECQVLSDGLDQIEHAGVLDVGDKACNFRMIYKSDRADAIQGDQGPPRGTSVGKCGGVLHCTPNLHGDVTKFRWADFLLVLIAVWTGINVFRLWADWKLTC